MAKDSRGTFIKIYRSAADNPLFKEKPFDRWHAFEYLLMRAQVRSETVILKGQRVKLERGQLIQGLDNLAQTFGWSRNKVRRFLQLLKDEQIANYNGTPNGTLITIENYSFYQDVRQPNGQPNEQPDGQPNEQPNEPQSKNNKNNKNDKNTPLYPPTGGRGGRPRRNEVWDMMREEMAKSGQG